MTDIKIRVNVQGYRGSTIDSQVFDFSEEVDPVPIKVKQMMTKLVNKAFDKNAEEKSFT